MPAAVTVPAITSMDCPPPRAGCGAAASAPGARRRTITANPSACSNAVSRVERLRARRTAVSDASIRSVTMLRFGVGRIRSRAVGRNCAPVPSALARRVK